NDLSASSTIYPGDVLQLSGGSSDATGQDAQVGPDAGSAESTGDTSVETSSTGDGNSHIQTASATSTASATGSKAAAIDEAVSIVNSGATYRLGANGPSQYDCSSLTQTDRKS